MMTASGVRHGGGLFGPAGAPFPPRLHGQPRLSSGQRLHKTRISHTQTASNKIPHSTCIFHRNLTNLGQPLGMAGVCHLVNGGEQVPTFVDAGGRESSQIIPPFRSFVPVSIGQRPSREQEGRARIDLAMAGWVTCVMWHRGIGWGIFVLVNMSQSTTFSAGVTVSNRNWMPRWNRFVSASHSSFGASFACRGCFLTWTWKPVMSSDWVASRG